MDSLQLIRDQVSLIIDYDILFRIPHSKKSYTDREVANFINGSNYAKAIIKFDAFKARCDQTLESMKVNLNMAEEEYNELVALANAASPGLAPSKMFLNRSDKAAVRAHNQRVRNYNREVKAHRAALKRVESAGSRYNNALSRYNEKLADLDMQIKEKSKDLPPALDKDIIIFFKKAKEIINALITRKRFFEASIVILLFDESYPFFREFSSQSLSKIELSEIIGDLCISFDKITDENIDVISSNFEHPSKLLKSKYLSNKAILNDISKLIKSLNYDSLEKYSDDIQNIISYAIEDSFDFQEIIDPEALSLVESNIESRKAEFKSISEKITNIVNKTEAQHNETIEVRLLCLEKINLMTTNKNNDFLKTLLDSLFILSVLVEPERFECMKNKRQYIDHIKTYIKTKLKIDIDTFYRELINSDFCILTAKNRVSENKIFNLLPIRELLIKKNEELNVSISKLDENLQKINDIPQEKSAALEKEIFMYLPISVIPLINFISLGLITNKTQMFLPAFKSKNPFYSSLRDSLIKRMNIFAVVHLLIAVIIASTSLSLNVRNKSIFYALSGSYILSSLCILGQGQQLKDAKSSSETQ